MKRAARFLDRSADVVRELGAIASRMALDVADAIDDAAERLRQKRWTPDPHAPCTRCDDTGITNGSGWDEGGDTCSCAMGVAREVHARETN